MEGGDGRVQTNPARRHPGGASAALTTTCTLVLNPGASVPSTRIRPVRDTRCAGNTMFYRVSDRDLRPAIQCRSPAHARRVRIPPHSWQRTQNDDLGCAHRSLCCDPRGRTPRIQPVDRFGRPRSIRRSTVGTDSAADGAFHDACPRGHFAWRNDWPSHPPPPQVCVEYQCWNVHFCFGGCHAREPEPAESVAGGPIKSF